MVFLIPKRVEILLQAASQTQQDANKLIIMVLSLPIHNDFSSMTKNIYFNFKCLETNFGRPDCMLLADI